MHFLIDKMHTPERKETPDLFYAIMTPKLPRPQLAASQAFKVASSELIEITLGRSRVIWQKERSFEIGKIFCEG